MSEFARRIRASDRQPAIGDELLDVAPGQAGPVGDVAIDPGRRGVRRDGKQVDARRADGVRHPGARSGVRRVRHRRDRIRSHPARPAARLAPPPASEGQIASTRSSTIAALMQASPTLKV